MRDYSREPEDKRRFTEDFDRRYRRFAAVYDLAVKVSPFWKAWLRQALPHLQGPRVLEVSFGTGYLLTQYAGRFESHGIDYNERMVAIAGRNLAGAGAAARIVRGTVEALPYRDGCFDTVLNTMSFTGYPDGAAALTEMLRVLKTGGRLVIIDVNYPANGNWLGKTMTDFWKRTGDLVRDMGSLFRAFSLDYADTEAGGFGSIHLYLAAKP